jgi:hypothetical protein
MHSGLEAVAQWGEGSGAVREEPGPRLREGKRRHSCDGEEMGRDKTALG